MRLFNLVAVLAVLAGGCGGDELLLEEEAPPPEVFEEKADSRDWTWLQGSIEYGHAALNYTYRPNPRYHAWAFQGGQSDTVGATVYSTVGRPYVWIMDCKARVIPGQVVEGWSRQRNAWYATINAKLPAGLVSDCPSTYYTPSYSTQKRFVVVRNREDRESKFTVSLDGGMSY